MNRSDIVLRLSILFPNLQHKDVELVVKVILDGISNAVSNGRRTEIRGFGSFGLLHKKARIAHNPKTRLEVSVPAKYLPHFRAGKELKERVDPNLFRSDGLHIDRLMTIEQV